MARRFNGTSDLIKATAGAIYGGSVSTFSMSAWVSGAAQQNRIFYMEGRNLSTGFISFGSENVVSGTKCRVVISSSGGTTLLDTTSTAVICDSTLHHVGFSLLSRNWKLYIDGVQDSSGGPITSESGFGESWAAMGCLARNTNSAFFSGNIMECANWEAVLPASWFAALAAGVPASHFAPLHYWPLWGADSPEVDIGNRINGGGGTVSHAPGTLTGTTAANGGRVMPQMFNLGV